MGSVVVAANPSSAKEPEVVIEGADFVTGIAFSANGRTMFFNEREGSIFAATGKGRPRRVASIATTTAGETGLLGIAVAPDNEDLYVFVTDPGGASNSVMRVPIEGGEPNVVVSGLPASLYHNGGGVAFDADGNLLVSNGETHNSPAAQDPEQRGGKIYRFTPSGDPAPGNPFGESIALGLRNPFTLAIDPVTGDAFVTDNGPASHDEVNRIRVGGNYGWPDVLGFSEGARPSGPGDYHEPISVLEEIVVPTGIAIADPSDARDDVAGDVFYGTFEEQTIRRIELNNARDRALSDEVFIRESEGVVALAWGPGGLYYSTPSAIKLVPLATWDRARDRPDPTFVGPPVRPDRDAFPWGLVTAGAVLLALAVVVVALVRR